MNQYLSSDKVNVFPASLRTYNGYGKYTTEFNLTGIVKSVVDKDSYIISRSLEDSPFKFVINGYYFEVNDTISGNNIFANIKIENTREYSRLNNLTGEIDAALDANDEFQALSFTSGNKDSNATHWLKLTDANGNICKDNFPKFDPESIGPGDVNSDSISQIWVDGALHIIEEIKEGGEVIGYKYLDKGCFETSTDGSLGFSQPVFFKAGVPDTVNTIFWGNTVPTEPQTINGVTSDFNVGDIFFDLSVS